jgi:hypothetical protein
MPWRDTSVMEERLRFVARRLEGEGLSDVCREFGTSRKTGHKILNRFKDDGLEAQTSTQGHRAAMTALPEIDYPLHDRRAGDQHLDRAGRTETGYQEVDDGIWLVSFMHHDLGYIDLRGPYRSSMLFDISNRKIRDYVGSTGKDGPKFGDQIRPTTDLHNPHTRTLQGRCVTES